MKVFAHLYRHRTGTCLTIAIPDEFIVSHQPELADQWLKEMYPDFLLREFVIQ